MDLTYWLRKTPQPAAILADDKRIEVPRNGRAWRDLTATIKAMEPGKLTCLDGAGNVIRSISLESDEEKPAVTPEMSDLQVFAKLLAEGYDKGSKSSQPLVDAAMTFVERQAQRLAKAEAEIERLRSHIHKQHLQILELSGAPAPAAEASVLEAMMAGMLQAQTQQGLIATPQAPVPTTNGTASTRPNAGARRDYEADGKKVK
jgi:hypothetical protein